MYIGCLYLAAKWHYIPLALGAGNAFQVCFNLATLAGCSSDYLLDVSIWLTSCADIALAQSWVPVVTDQFEASI